MLKAVESKDGGGTEEWLKGMEQYHAEDVVGDGENVWIALKQLTEGEARKVVMSTQTGDGYGAWKRLHARFGPSLAAKQGMVMNDLLAMVQKPAKNPAETRSLITELDKRVKTAEEITGTALDGNMVKSVLVAVLDPTTRQHTAMHHGLATSLQDLRQVVLEFANNVTPAKGDSSAMQIGRVGETETAEHGEQWGPNEQWQGEN